MASRRHAVCLAALLGLWGSGASAEPGFVWGVKAAAGGRYDDVRMCIASDPGVKGGPAMEVYLFAEVGRSGNTHATIHLPVARPLLFGAAFKMLQLEPDVSIDFHHALTGSLDLVYGPRIGLSFHYGPDYRSGPKDEERGPDFFALGPKLGLSLALHFRRPGKTDFLVGINPYFIPLIAADKPTFPDGIVAGGMLEGALRWGD